jgi:hypothetical protein
MTTLSRSELWARAAASSVAWRALAPARRLWTAAEAAVARASGVADSETAEQVNAKEALAISIVESSRLFRAADTMVDTVAAAWRESIAGVAARRAIGVLRRSPTGDLARSAGGVTVVASATALAMQRLAPTAVPYQWIVPAMFLLLGICLIAVAIERPVR